jgi:predicted transcriptional regulator
LRKLSDNKERILLRRSLVTEYYSQGLNEAQIAKRLNIPRPTIYADMSILRRQAITNISTFIEKKLPHEYESLMTGDKILLRKAWDVLENEQSSEKAVANAMFTILKCYEHRRELIMGMIEVQKGVSMALGDKVGLGLESHHMLVDKQRVEAFQAEKHRSQAIF